jgi:hypothetical protein
MSYKRFLCIFFMVVILVLYIRYIKYRFTQCITVNPYATPKSGLSVVILNYKRPHNLEYMIPILHDYKYVQDIVIMNGDENYMTDFSHLSKVKQYKDKDIVKQFLHDNKIGGGIRFFAPCALDHILFLDDDHCPSEVYVNMGLYMLESDPTGLFGNTHRRCAKSYSLYKHFFTYANMVLTQCMFVHKHVLQAILPPLRTYIPLLEKTRGNGEDIIFNYIYRSLYGRIPIRILSDGHIKTLDENTHSYRGSSKHLTIRSAICKMLHKQEKNQRRNSI